MARRMTYFEFTLKEITERHFGEFVINVIRVIHVDNVYNIKHCICI